MKTGLFIGRFQPFHDGHLEVINRALKQVDVLKIAIGSAQAEGTMYNPFSSAERGEMIKRSLPSRFKKSVLIYILPDIDDPLAWPKYVKKVVGSFDILFTGNIDGVVKLFREVYPDMDMMMFGTSGNNLSGTEIRNRIASGKASWRKFVPKGTLKEMDEMIHPEEYIKNLYKKGGEIK